MSRTSGSSPEKGLTWQGFTEASADKEDFRMSGGCRYTEPSVPPATIEVTILGKKDFVVIVRRWRQQGPVRRPSGWAPVGVVSRRNLAEAMVALLREASVWTEARAVSHHELLHEIREEDRERILARLNSRTKAEIKRDLELRWAAATRLAGLPDRRSGRDRRTRNDRRRSAEQSLPPAGERRRGRDRRSGRDRRLRYSL
jgi:hypothetical protein